MDRQQVAAAARRIVDDADAAWRLGLCTAATFSRTADLATCAVMAAYRGDTDEAERQLAKALEALNA